MINILIATLVYFVEFAVLLLISPFLPYLLWVRGMSLAQIRDQALSTVIDVLYAIILPLVSPFIIYRMYSKNKYRDTIKERLGGLSHLPKKKKTIWIHGVSVGEIKGAWGLVEKLKKSLPDREIIISATSTAGKKIAKELYPDCLVISFPLDFSWVISRYIRHFDPTLIVLVELEIWPNFTHCMHRNNIPIVLVNGRLSQKSFRGYNRYLRNFFPWITRGIFRFATQNDLYLERFSKIGIERERLLVTGNMKFDVIDPEKWMAKKESLCQQLDIEPNYKVLVMGSSHAHEEEIILACYQRLIEHFPDVRLIIVPRHPDRKGEIARLVRKHGLAAVQKSSIKNGEFCFEAKNIIIGDIMGELAEIYTVAYITIIGGSFVPRGGQNFIEPASLEKAVVCGPFMENFPEITGFLEQHALLQLESTDHFYNALSDLLLSPEKVEEMGKKASYLIKQSQGSSARNCELCLQALTSLLPDEANPNTAVLPTSPE